MADFPTGVYAPRTKANVSQVVYDPTKSTRHYAEDVVNLDEEVVAIEETLGENPQGSEDTVADRILALEEAPGVPAPAQAPILQAYMLQNASSVISGYDVLSALSAFSASGLGTAGVIATTFGVLLKSFSSDLGFPNITLLPAGNFKLYFDVQKTAGANSYYVYAEIYKRATGGSETLLFTTSSSVSSASNSVQNIAVVAAISSSVALLSSDKIVLKVYAKMVSSTATVTLRYDSTTSARLEFPSLVPDSTTVVPYVGATRNFNAGSYGVIANFFCGDGAGLQGNSCTFCTDFSRTSCCAQNLCGASICTSGGNICGNGSGSISGFQCIYGTATCADYACNAGNAGFATCANYACCAGCSYSSCISVCSSCSGYAFFAGNAYCAGASSCATCAGCASNATVATCARGLCGGAVQTCLGSLSGDNTGDVTGFGCFFGCSSSAVVANTAVCATCAGSAGNASTAGFASTSSCSTCSGYASSAGSLTGPVALANSAYCACCGIGGGSFSWQDLAFNTHCMCNGIGLY